MKFSFICPIEHPQSLLCLVCPLAPHAACSLTVSGKSICNTDRQRGTDHMQQINNSLSEVAQPQPQLGPLQLQPAPLMCGRQPQVVALCALVVAVAVVVVAFVVVALRLRLTCRLNLGKCQSPSPLQAATCTSFSPFPTLYFALGFLIGLSVCFLQQVNMVIVIVIGALPGCNLAIATATATCNVCPTVARATAPQHVARQLTIHQVLLRLLLLLLSWLDCLATG